MPSEDQAWVPLSIGAVFGGGPVAPALAEAISVLAGLVERAVESLPVRDISTEASVNLVFDVPGIFVTPDYSGMRTGVWIGMDRRQIVEVAVPADLREPDAVREFLAHSLEAAIPMASERLARFRRSSHLSLAGAAAAASAAAAALRQGPGV